MNRENIISKVDHTLLSQNARWQDIKLACDEGIKYGAASVCIPPCYVSKAAKYVADRIPICTVIGFPNGYIETSVKCYETEQAISDGASEIDMVINIGYLKAGDLSAVGNEIKRIKNACTGKLLKVIVETCLLTREEKIAMCRLVSMSDADFIKTSTGFAGGGATADDIKLFAENVNNGTKIKAAGGIANFDDAKLFLELGASRLGTSKLIKILKDENNQLGSY